MVRRRDLLLGGLAVAGLAAAGLGLKWRGGAKAATETFEVIHTPEEWRKLLTPEQYAVLREEDTERPSPARSTTRSARAPSPAPAATCRCSPPRPSSIAAPAGRASMRRSRTRSRQARLDVRHGQGRGALPPLRRPSRPCVQRRPEAHGAALLHQRRLAEIRPGLSGPPWDAHGFRAQSGSADFFLTRRWNLPPEPCFSNSAGSVLRSRQAVLRG